MTHKYAISLGLSVLWGIWGIDLIKHIPFHNTWWETDVQITLWMLPYAVLLWFGLFLKRKE